MDEVLQCANLISCVLVISIGSQSHSAVIGLVTLFRLAYIIFDYYAVFFIGAIITYTTHSCSHN